jgi:hypothetical protein
MFYDGDLQGAIALALQEQKPIVCFVADASEESSKWEDSWLHDAEVHVQTLGPPAGH